MSQKMKFEICVDLDRAGYDKSVEKILAFQYKYLRSCGRFANLFQLPSQITLIEKFDVKVYLQELRNKIELSDIKNGNFLRNINRIALIFGTLTHNNIS